MSLVPACGANERVNALVHVGISALYALMLAYHAAAVVRHWWAR